MAVTAALAVVGAEAWGGVGGVRCCVVVTINKLLLFVKGGSGGDSPPLSCVFRVAWDILMTPHA